MVAASFVLSLSLIDALSTKTECDYLNGWIKNGHIRKNLTQNGEPQRYSWGVQKKKKTEALSLTILSICGEKNWPEI